MVEKVAASFGSIDILINNAGVAAFGPTLELTEAEWDRVIDTNLKGSFLCAQAVGKKMVEQKKGAIISLASQFAFKAIPNFGVYSIAKAGIVMLTRILARELGGQGVRVNAIAPGLVKTELTRVEWEDPVLMKNRVAGIPLGRVAEPSDLAGLVLFLASDASSYISGQAIIIDGAEIT
jgi:2-deoxy-D-gluconate 3-dehydrogenase